MRKRVSVKPLAKTAKISIDFIRSCESVIKGSDPMSLQIIFCTDIDSYLVLFSPPNKILIQLNLFIAESVFKSKALDVMATYWCSYEYTRRQHNARLALVPNTTVKPILYAYGSEQWLYFRNKLRLKVL